MAEAAASRAEDKLILVVDDDPGIVSMFMQAVKIEGFKVESAGDGEEALEKIAALKPDLVLLDLMMPGYGGFEVIQELKTGPGAGTPIIVITGRFTDSATADEIRREPSVVAFLEKPVRPADLAAVLHKTLKTNPPKKGRR